MLRLPSLFFAVAFIATAASCATTGGAIDVDSFPTRDDLARLASRELPPLKADARADTASWTLQGPLPNRFGDAPVTAAATGLDAFLLTHLPPAKTSENLTCAARELGAFYLEHNKYPEHRLYAWILERCGVTNGGVALHTLAWDVTDKTTDADLWDNKEARAEIGDMIEKKKDEDHVAIAFMRSDKAGKALLVIASIDASGVDAILDPGSQIVAADSASIVVSGTLTKAAEVAYAYATKGLLAAQECTQDQSVVLPRFRFTCPVDAADGTARVDIDARRKGRVLSENVASLVVVRDVATASEYREATYVDGAPSDDVLAQINRVRATANLKPLAKTPAQSASANKVAPHYFANMLSDSHDENISDVVALGLMAGWEVTELTIHDAGFATLLDASGNGDDLLGYALDHAMPRAILLNPKMSAAAVGTATLEGGMKGAVVVTYEELVPPDHATAAAAVFEKLRAVRNERRLGVTGSIPTEKIMLDAAQQLQAGGDMQAIAHTALEASAKVMGRPFTIWTMEVHDVDHLAFPDELLTTKETYVAISVATRKHPRSAWGSTVVLVLGFVDDTARVAMVNE